MIRVSDKSRCCGCEACVNICPSHCIQMVSDSEGFLYPVPDMGHCLSCGKCEDICPVLHPAVETSVKPAAWAAMNRSDAVRKESSSGGVFSLLAESVIQNGGVVFGAAFNECFDVEHIAVETMEDLARLRGSKYTQSRIGTVFQQVRHHLKAGREVLFSGTPCQIEGLRVFLGADYANLLLIDLVCHGVPSPLVWREYVAFRETKNASQTRRISSRHKKYGWKRFSVSFTFMNDTEYLAPLERDVFMRAFLTDCCLRPSCGTCAFKKIGRASDITLADFWGIQSVLPPLDDDKGTSLVIVHSPKGTKAFDAVSSSCTRASVALDAALRGNPAMTKSVVFHKNRSKFFGNLKKLPFDVLVKRYATRKYTLKSCVAEVLRRLGLLDRVKAMLGKGA